MSTSAPKREYNLNKDSLHSGITESMTFEAWLKEDKFKTQVILPFKEYLKDAFRERHHLLIQYRHLLSTANDSVTRKAMAHAQEASNADSDAVLPPLAEGDVGTNHDTSSGQLAAEKRCAGTHLNKLPFRYSTNRFVVEKPTGTRAVDGQESSTWSSLSDLKSRKRRTPNPEDDDDDAEYRAEDEENEVPETSRTKSVRISNQPKRVKLTWDAM